MQQARFNIPPSLGSSFSVWISARVSLFKIKKPLLQSTDGNKFSLKTEEQIYQTLHTTRKACLEKQAWAGPRMKAEEEKQQRKGNIVCALPISPGNHHPYKANRRAFVSDGKIGLKNAAFISIVISGSL